MEIDENLSKKVKSSIFWRLMERVGVQFFSFLVSLFLARLLDPEAYGLIALVTVFISIMNVFVDSGLGTALIQKKDADELDFSSVFYFNIIVCSFFYFLLFIGAPFIAAFYNVTELTSVIRVLGIVILISGVKNIQIAYVSKKLVFKKFFFSTIGGTIVSAIVGIVLALNGMGVWSLVFLNLVNTFVDAVILWITVGWYPVFRFSFTRVKSLFSFSLSILASNLINTIYNNLEQLVIGKKYDSLSLAFYNKGFSFPSLIFTTIDSSLQSVLFPTLSILQDDKESMCNMMKKTVNISSYLVFPLLIGLSVCAEPFITLLLTDKWLPCVPYIRIFSMVYIFVILYGVKTSAIKAIGKAKLCLVLDIISKGYSLIILLITMHISVMAISIGLLAGHFIYFVIVTFICKIIFNFKILDQIKDSLLNLFIAIIMGCIVFVMKFIFSNYVILLIVQVFCGVVIYVLLSFLFRRDNLQFVFNMIFKRK